MSLTCPHCLQKSLIVRSSAQECPTLRSLWVQCKNVNCGFTGRGYTEITHEISPSATPNHQIQLRAVERPRTQAVA